MSPQNAVFAMAELLEGILLFLPPPDVFVAAGVNEKWRNTIDKSLAIQRQLLLYSRTGCWRVTLFKKYPALGIVTLTLCRIPTLCSNTTLPSTWEDMRPGHGVSDTQFIVRYFDLSAPTSAAKRLDMEGDLTIKEVLNRLDLCVIVDEEESEDEEENDDE